MDLSGKIYGRWTVLMRSRTSKKYTYKWTCRCTCGTVRQVRQYGLISGTSTSCGCKRVDSTRKHGDHLTRLYGLWRNMRYRCRCASSKDFDHYGARGISVCKSWEEYQTFKEWAMSNGYAEGLSIERKDTNGDYCAENCKFATTRENNQNKTNGHYWFVYGKRFVSSWEAARFWGVCNATICSWCGKRGTPPAGLCYTVRMYR